VRPNTLETRCDLSVSQCDVRGILDWTASSEERNVLASGAADFDYNVKLTDDGFLIVSESSSVLSRQTDKIRSDAH
jgi:hypothetical protein